MALCNPLGDLNLESTQQELLIELIRAHERLLRELKIMNLHLAKMSDERINEEEVDVN